MTESTSCSVANGLPGTKCKSKKHNPQAAKAVRGMAVIRHIINIGHAASRHEPCLAVFPATRFLPCWRLLQQNALARSETIIAGREMARTRRPDELTLRVQIAYFSQRKNHL
jgi:hypothetical protein